MAMFNAQATALLQAEMTLLNRNLSYEKIKRLINSLGADPNVKSTDGNETLIQFIFTNLRGVLFRMSHDELRNILILFVTNPNFDVNAVNDNCDPLLNTLLYSNPFRRDLLEILLSNPRVDVNLQISPPNRTLRVLREPPLVAACCSPEHADDRAQMLLERGANPNCVELQTGDSPLHILIKKRNRIHHGTPQYVFNIVKTLIDYGANPNQYNATFDTPFHLVIKLKEAGLANDLTVFFLQNGGDPLKTDMHERNVFDLAQSAIDQQKADIDKTEKFMQQQRLLQSRAHYKEEEWATKLGNMRNALGPMQDTLGILDRWMEERRVHYRLLKEKVLPAELYKSVGRLAFRTPCDNSKRLRFDF